MCDVDDFDRTIVMISDGDFDDFCYELNDEMPVLSLGSLVPDDESDVCYESNDEFYDAFSDADVCYESNSTALVVYRGSDAVDSIASTTRLPLPDDESDRFRDAALNAKIVFPSDTKTSDVTTAYITRLTTYIEHACSIWDDLLSCLCVSGENHCDEPDTCSSHCYVCSIDSVVGSLLLLCRSVQEGVLSRGTLSAV